MRPLVGRQQERTLLHQFANTPSDEATLGLVWGRRRIGKSMLLHELTRETGGFYFHALRGASGEALAALGEALAVHTGAPAPLALTSWEQAVEALMALGRERPTVVVLDEFPYLLEHTPSLESILQRHFGPGHPSRAATRTRLLLCGSAIGVMNRLLVGTAPLRGRAGLALRMTPFDFRVSRELHGITHLPTAVATQAVIGGVAAYAREMTGHDLPRDPADFDRWVVERVLSPAAPLFGEIELLLGEDPTTSKARKINLYHAVQSGVAQGYHAWSALCGYVQMSGSSLQPVMDALLSTDLLVRQQDPIRDNRPLYHPNDSLLRFHYAIIRRHQPRLARYDADRSALWNGLVPTFRSLVLGPSFEQMARYWTLHFASPATLGGVPAHVGSTVLAGSTGAGQELDVVAAGDADGAPPDQRPVLAIGEAKVGEPLGLGHLQALDQARRTLGPRGRDARLLLFGTQLRDDLRALAATRPDVELIDLERLYYGD